VIVINNTLKTIGIVTFTKSLQRGCFGGRREFLEGGDFVGGFWEIV
jgi:hypothetical protein